VEQSAVNLRSTDISEDLFKKVTKDMSLQPLPTDCTFAAWAK